MNLRLQIFSSSFVVIFAALHLLPLFQATGEELKPKRECARMEKPVCKKLIKPTCNKNSCAATPSGEGEKSEGCRSNGCNPFVPCSMGFCCYLVESFFTYSVDNSTERQRLAVFDDNRQSRGTSDCWHPPEWI